MSITLTSLMQQRRDTAANWTSNNPTLLNGEIGYETDTGYLKIGDGSTAWTSLGYVDGTKVSAYPLATVDIANDAITADQLANTSVTAGTYTAADITVDAQGRITAAASGTISTSEIADNAVNGDKLADDITIANDLTVTNNLTVNGTTTTINSTTLQVDDKNIELGTVATPSDATANGGGITLKGSSDHTITWTNSTDSWDFSEHVDIASAKEFRIGGTKVLDATSLGSSVVSSSLTSVGTIGTGVWNGTPIAAAYLANTAVTAGTYTAASITVDAQGRLTSASSNTIPTNNNQLTNGAGYTTFDGDYNSLTNTPTIPTNNNQLTNGAGYITSADGGNADTVDSLHASSFLRADAADTFSGDLTSSGSARLILKTDSNVSDHIQFFNGTTRVGEIGCENNNFLEINKETANNIFTPRYIRADGGFFVDGTTKGINGSGNFIGGTIAGASDYGTLLRSDAADSFSGALTGSGTISVTGTKIECGRTSGSVAMTTNDGHGNANLCFNHTSGVPDVNGSSCRIETGVDNTSGVMVFEIADNVTAGVTPTVTQTLRLTTSDIQYKGNTVWHAGNFDPGSIPQNAKTAAYTLVATDAGKHISITTGGVTVPSGVFSIGDAVTIYNDSTSNQTITASGVTLRIAGYATSGNKTLAQYGLATLLCVGSNIFVIGGAGVS